MKSKTNKGITLIALVITIIVLLILAAVSIATLTGENGILTKASTAKVDEAHASVKEGMTLVYGEYQIEQQSAKEPAEETFMEYVQRDEFKYVDTDGRIDTNVLLGHKLSIGNGTGATDVYKLEEEEEKYILKYYGEDGSELVLRDFSKNNVIVEEGPEPTDPKYFSYTYDEEARTATITGINENYIGTAYYRSDWGDERYFPIYIIDGETKITDVVFPSKVKKGDKIYTVTKIADYAFSYDTWYDQYVSQKSEFTSFWIPSTVTSIGADAFEGGYSLKSVYFNQTIPPTFGGNCFEKHSGEKTTFYFRNETVSNKFTTSHYSSYYGTKSTDYNW